MEPAPIKNKMKLLLHFEKQTIHRFSNFIDVIYGHRGTASGIIMNFNKDTLVVIYSYRDEKEEALIENYFEYNESSTPYISFVYILTQKTISNLVFEKAESEDDIITLRMQMSEFLDFAEFLKKEAVKHENLIMKVRSVSNDILKKNENYFFLICQIEEDKSVRQDTVKIKTPKKTYPIKLADCYYNLQIMTIHFDSFAVWKEVAEKWNCKLQASEKNWELSYFIIFPIFPENEVIKIKIIYDSKSIFTMLIPKTNVEMHPDFEQSAYKVSTVQFIQLMRAWKESNYNNECHMIFASDRIVFSCATIGLNSMEKKENANLYSYYAFRIMAKKLDSEEEVQKILDFNLKD